jgi:hypothetical protein
MKNNIYKKLFIFFVLIVLSIPIITLSGGEDFMNLYGYRSNEKKPEVLFKNYEKGEFQKFYEVWFNNNFYGRNFLIKLKNTLYYWANFRYFVINNNYFISKDRVVGTKVHLNAFLSESYRKSDKENIKEVFPKLLYVQQELEKSGKQVIFIMAPNGIRFFRDKQYEYLKYFNDYNTIDGYQIYTEYLKKYKINYFDAQSFLSALMSENNIYPSSYLDLHWNRYGAGMVMIETLKELKNRYHSNWNIPEIESIEYSSKPMSYEDESSRRINLLYPYTIEGYKFPYLVYKKINNNKTSIRVTLFGDSYCATFYDQILDSGFTDENSLTSFENSDIGDNSEKAYKKIDEILKNTDIVIIIYTEYNFFSLRINALTDSFYNYFKWKNENIALHKQSL